MIWFIADFETMLLSKQLTTLLKENDLTVTQLARATKISSKTLYQWLHGSSPRNLDQLRAVADHFDVTVDYLLFNRKIPHKKSYQNFQGEIEAGIFEVILRKVRDDKI